LNLGFFGGYHIIAFGVPHFPREGDGPAAIRDSSHLYSVGSKK
jgi:hypothetical protein